MTKRATILLALVAAGTLSLTAAALQEPPKVIEVEKVRDNLFVLKGGGGNTAVFVRADGVTVVDAKNPGWGQPILSKINELTNKPVTTLINTHTHGDHVSGNVEFPVTVDIVTQENTKANMEKMIPNSTAQNQTPPSVTIFQANGGKGLPKRTFKDKMSIGGGNDRIDLYYFGRGHTNGDAFVVFPALRVMHAGDVFSGKNLPLLDTNNGGSGVALPDTLKKAADTVTAIDTIITGHSTTMTPNDMKEYADFNRDFLAAMREGKKAGKSVEDLAGSWKILPKYVGYTIAPERLKANVKAVFDEIK